MADMSSYITRATQTLAPNYDAVVNQLNQAKASDNFVLKQRFDNNMAQAVADRVRNTGILAGDRDKGQQANYASYMLQNRDVNRGMNSQYTGGVTETTLANMGRTYSGNNINVNGIYQSGVDAENANYNKLASGYNTDYNAGLEQSNSVYAKNLAELYAKRASEINTMAQQMYQNDVAEQQRQAAARAASSGGGGGFSNYSPTPQPAPKPAPAGPIKKPAKTPLPTYKNTGNATLGGFYSIR